MRRNAALSLGTPLLLLIASAQKAMRDSTDAKDALTRVESRTIEIGGADDSRHSTGTDRRSRLTFWPLLQQSQP